MRSIVAIAVAALSLFACSPSYDRFGSAEEIRDVLVEARVSCDAYIDELTKHGPDVLEASWGQCDSEDGYATFMVFPDRDALTWLKRIEGRAQDDTPRQYWVYGENWFVGTDNPALQAEMSDILGGETASNTDF